MKSKKKKSAVHAKPAEASSEISAGKPESSARKPGRPVGSKSGPRGAAGAHAVRAQRKTADDIKDTRAAIVRYREDINKLVGRYKNEHPGAAVAEVPDPFRIATREPVDPKIFLGLLMPPTILIYAGLDVKSALPESETFEKCAMLWSEASKHFEESKWLPLIAALMTTLGLVGGAPIARLTLGADSDRRDIRVDVIPPAPPPEGSPSP